MLEVQLSAEATVEYAGALQSFVRTSASCPSPFEISRWAIARSGVRGREWHAEQKAGEETKSVRTAIGCGLVCALTIVLSAPRGLVFGGRMLTVQKVGVGD